MFDKEFVRRIFEIGQGKWQEGKENFVNSAPPNNKIKKKDIDGECSRQWKEQKKK